MIWQTARFRIDLSVPRVMGIVNVTPDSFSDGGQFLDPADAVRHCERLVAEGAGLLDLGGESTRPGAVAPDSTQEWARLEPVLRHALTLGVPVSVDTSNPVVMRAALDLGADIINDVRSLSRPGALDILAAHATAGICLMHMRGEPGQMQMDPVYDDVVASVREFLLERCAAVLDAGVSRERIVLDPGIGFGKTLAHNVELMRRQAELLTLRYPLMVGWSRKSTLGRLTGRPADERVAASVAAALMAVDRGARVVRVHDVAPTVDALKVWLAIGQNPAQRPVDTRNESRENEQ